MLLIDPEPDLKRKRQSSENSVRIKTEPSQTVDGFNWNSNRFSLQNMIRVGLSEENQVKVE